LTAGNRRAGGERLPLGRPGERPQGFGTFTGLPSCARMDEKPRRTRAGLRRSGGSRGCHGKRTSPPASRARRRCTEARMRSQVQRSAAAGERSLGVVQRSVCLKKRKVCSSENRARYARQTAAQSGGVGPYHQNQSGVGALVGRGSRSTSSRINVPRMSGRGRRLPRVAWWCGVACSPLQAWRETCP
jgi:hypothetical protein